MKKIFLIAILIILIPVLLYTSIVVANNTLAKSIEKNLIAYSLPEKTELIGSISKAGKLNGNGNGMQYMGAILVTSDLSEKQLLEYYSKDFDYVEVKMQKSNELDFDVTNGQFQAELEKSKTYYSVVCWDIGTKINPFFAFVLDLDLRGH